MTNLTAYHNNQANKDAIIGQLKLHCDADEIIKGQYWEDGKGCAVGCTIHSDNHAEYEARFGIPEMLARLEDVIFEGLPNDAAKAWPIRFMSAIEPGADLSTIGWKFLHWLLTDEKANPGINDPIVKDAIKQCADVLVPLTKGLSVDASAAWSAASAARSAARSAASAESAARSAARSAASAESAAWSAASAAWSAASAESAAWSAARAAGAAWSAESAAYVLFADKLLNLIKDAPIASVKGASDE